MLESSGLGVGLGLGSGVSVSRRQGSTVINRFNPQSRTHLNCSPQQLKHKVSNKTASTQWLNGEQFEPLL
jgi:hypothetical protein